MRSGQGGPQGPKWSDRLLYPILTGAAATILAAVLMMGAKSTGDHISSCPAPAFERAQAGESAFLKHDYALAGELAEEALALGSCREAQILSARVHLELMSASKRITKVERAEHRRKCFKHVVDAVKKGSASPQESALKDACSVEQG